MQSRCRCSSARYFSDNTNDPPRWERCRAYRQDGRALTLLKAAHGRTSWGDRATSLPRLLTRNGFADIRITAEAEKVKTQESSPPADEALRGVLLSAVSSAVGKSQMTFRHTSDPRRAPTKNGAHPGNRTAARRNPTARLARSRLLTPAEEAAHNAEIPLSTRWR